MLTLLQKLTAAVALLHATGSFADQPVFEVPRGTYHYVEYTEEIRTFTLRCGFTKIGTPGLGRFTREHRVYITYDDKGQVVNQEAKVVDVFVECTDPGATE